jgi:hypothetical protein
MVLVAFSDGDVASCACHVLTTNGAPPMLRSEDAVLVLLPGSDEDRGVVLGRVGPYVEPEPQAEHPPDELVIEARKGLTLRCGDGSVSIREDGKILIKGKDLVSHARRMNRIKGGAVAIN